MSAAVDARSATRAIAVPLIPLERLHESPFNRRRNFGDLAELAKSIEGVGILEPLLARPHPSKPGDFELVFGHRRLRAAHKTLKLAPVPVQVRELNDAQVIEAQAVENLQRQDIHPLEEAEQYEQLQKIGRSVAEIAAKVGKSTTYVLGRAKLLSLCEPVRKAFAKGEVSTAVALLLARIPTAELQQKALEDVVGDGPYLMALDDARAHIRDRYMHRLDNAVFDRADAALVAKAGPCTTCPKRTGAQKELFGDLKSGDLCTDPPCFESKLAAHGKRRLALAKEQGKDVLEGTAGVRAVQVAQQWRGKVVDLNAVCNEDPKRRTFGALLEKSGAEVKTTVALDRDAHVHEIAGRNDVAKAIAKVVKIERAFSEQSSLSRHERSPSKNEAKRKGAVAELRVRSLAIAGAIVAAAERRAESPAVWSLVAREMLNGLDYQIAEEICKRRGLACSKNDGIKALEKIVVGRLDHTRGLAIELLLAQDFDFHPYRQPTLGRTLVAAAAAFEVDAKKIGDAAVKAQKASTPPPASTKKKAARGGR